MEEIEREFRKPKALLILQHILQSRYLFFFSAMVICVLYYLALDIVSIYYMVIVFILMLLFLRDLTPILPHVLIIAILSSVENVPSELAGNSNYYSQPVIYIQIGVLAILFLAAFVLRFVVIARQGTFKPGGIFWGLCILCATFLLSGAGSAEYTWMNLAYGTVLSLCFLGIYVLFAGSVKITEENMIKLCWGFLAVSVVLVIEEIVKYIQCMPELKDYLSGAITYEDFKKCMVYGWGVWNTIGLYFNLCIPPVLLLASKYKHGWALVLYATLLCGFTVLTCSRQALIGLVVTYPLPAIVAIVKNKRWKVSLCIVCAAALAVIIFCLCNISSLMEMVAGVLDSIVDSEGNYTGNGRMHLIMEAMEHFADYPFFGAGWFMGVADNSDTMINVSAIPSFACDTFAELLGACGMVGLLAYCIHRFQTILEFLKNPSADKLILSMIILAILFMSLVDSHIFYLLPTIVYAGLLPFVCTDKKEEPMLHPSILPGEVQNRRRQQNAA